MFTAVLAAVAVASAGAQNAQSTNAPTTSITDHKLSETTTNTSIQTIQVVQSSHPYPGLDVHIQPIDPAADLLPKLFSA